MTLSGIGECYKVQDADGVGNIVKHETMKVSEILQSPGHWLCHRCCDALDTDNCRNAAKLKSVIVSAFGDATKPWILMVLGLM